MSFHLALSTSLATPKRYRARRTTLPPDGGRPSSSTPAPYARRVHRPRSADLVAGLAALVVAVVWIPLTPTGPPLASATQTHRTSSTRPGSATTFAPSTSTSTSTTTPPVTAPGAPGWTTLGVDSKGIASETRSFTAPSGREVTLVRFDAGAVVFDLHVGSTDPPADLSALPGDRGPALATDELASLLGAFNGGFKMNVGQGGVEVAGHTLAPLVPGRASLVIDADGTPHVGVWGEDLPGPGEQVMSVRQNQAPLISHGVVNPTAADPAAWGATVNSSMVVARSALGQDAAGNITYAGGMSLLPADLAAALVSVGVVNGMQLDINPEWVQLDAAGAPGAPLATEIPGQNRPADQYLRGWTRDFIVVLGWISRSAKKPACQRPAGPATVPADRNLSGWARSVLFSQWIWIMHPGAEQESGSGNSL